MRSLLLVVSGLAGAAFAGNEHLRRRSVNDQAVTPAPTPPPALYEAADLRKRQDPLSSFLEEQSILNVLATALPASLLEIAITNPGVVPSILSADFASSQTPSWYQALPADVKTYLATASVGAAGYSVPSYSIPSYSISIPSYSIPVATDSSYAAELSSLLALNSVSYSNPYLTTQTTVVIGGFTSASSPRSSTSNAALSTQQKSSSGGLSPGAKIGIGVGVPAAVLAIAAIAAIFLISSHRRKKKSNAANSTMASTHEAKPGGMPPPQPQYATQPGHYYPPYGQAAELPPQSHVPELQSNQRPMYEMYG